MLTHYAQEITTATIVSLEICPPDGMIYVYFGLRMVVAFLVAEITYEILSLPLRQQRALRY